VTSGCHAKAGGRADDEGAPQGGVRDDRRVEHAVVEPVLAWYAAAARDLPWRAAERTPWGVLVSEIMLQQTPVARVEPVWRTWMERWPTPADLAAATTADVLRAWDRLGYPRRALRLQACAQAVAERHAGVVPDGEAALLALPGVGPYTAAAVMAFAHGRRSVVLDTNVRRVIARSVAGEALAPVALTASEVATAAAVVPQDHTRAAAWSAAVMELGALVCTARAPRCEVCPIAAVCVWRAAGMPADALAATRRRQTFEGTDRQARGRVMAVLRGANHPVPAGAFIRSAADGDQRRRVLAGLVADGLVEEVAGSPGAGATYRLPGSAPVTAR
jgi:A/G-specific adenine glycosylase